MRVLRRKGFIYLFRQNPVFISLHLRSPVHVAEGLKNGRKSSKLFIDDIFIFALL
jgi:hypothetical protein